MRKKVKKGFRISDRSFMKEGCFADVSVFDNNKFLQTWNLNVQQSVQLIDVTELSNKNLNTLKKNQSRRVLKAVISNSFL